MSQKNQQSVVRAIDVGFCNTKFTMVGNGGSGIGCDLFPSLTPIASGDSGLSDMMKKKRNVKVDVGGKQFEVGYDVESAIASNYGRTMDPSFCMTDNYMALVNGALYFMEQPEIDMLVLGLPVSAHKKYKEQLAKKMEGTHILPGREVVIKNCRVIAQPVGGFFQFGSQEGNLDKFQKETNLIIDVGFYTLDWFLCSSMRPVEPRCGAAENGGMGSVVHAIASEISRKIGEKLDHNIYHRIDNALRTESKVVKIFGVEYNLNDFMKVGQAAVMESVNKMINTVGNGSDIDNIVLVGGGGWFFEEVLKSKFPRHKISLVGESAFSNVIGFQMFGFETLKKIKQAEAATA
ncbi:MAG: PRTRC system protein D [Methylophilus sp.]|uniref:PRTRC system protein D n=1 Tax=Methylophilus sp. TaxID=29541 RepID=UPI003F9ED4F4